MSMTFDVAAVARELDRLVANPHLHKLSLVLPLDLGKRDVARAYLDEGPPFDLRGAGVDAHEVFLTDEEAIFVFGVPDGPQTLERILADEDSGRSCPRGRASPRERRASRAWPMTGARAPDGALPIVVLLLAALFACVGCGSAKTARTAERTPIVVDTDMGPDDALALIYLVSRRDSTCAPSRCPGPGSSAARPERGARSSCLPPPAETASRSRVAATIRSRGSTRSRPGGATGPTGSSVCHCPRPPRTGSPRRGRAPGKRLSTRLPAAGQRRRARAAHRRRRAAAHRRAGRSGVRDGRRARRSRQHRSGP